MKSVTDFITDHKPSDDIIVLGQCPSSKTEPFKNGTFARLQKWLDYADISEWSFHNVIPNKINSYDMNDVDVDALRKAIEGKSLIIALGGFVSKVCKKYDISHVSIDHPSPRNRNLNDPKYEKALMEKLKVAALVWLSN